MTERFPDCRQAGPWAAVVVVMLMLTMHAGAQNRGVYPLGMSATNSGITPAPGFTYSNQLLFYSRDHAKDDDGHTKPVTGNNFVLMDMNSLVWVSKWKILGARYSATATLPFAKNDLTSDIHGNISGGGGFADSYYMPFILGWSEKRVSVRLIYGFLAPTGRYDPAANNNVGSGYWTHALSSGQSFQLLKSKKLTLSTFEMYEFHTTQEGTGIHPGDTFDLDHSLLWALPLTGAFRAQIGLAGYEARQTTAKTGPGLAPALSDERYAVNALGFAATGVVPKHKVSMALKLFKEFANRSTFQGYSVQVLGAIKF
jgi:hypothetical protein